MPVLSGLLLTMAVPQHDRDLAAWMATYGPGLRRYFRRRADDADVDDLVQEVFLRLQSAQLSTPIDNVERYLFAAARNSSEEHPSELQSLMRISSAVFCLKNKTTTTT